MKLPADARLRLDERPFWIANRDDMGIPQVDYFCLRCWRELFEKLKQMMSLRSLGGLKTNEAFQKQFDCKSTQNHNWFYYLCCQLNVRVAYMLSECGFSDMEAEPVHVYVEWVEAF